MVLNFCSGPDCNLDESREVSVTSATTTLCYVGTNRRRSPPNLRSQTETLILWKSLGLPINVDRHAMCYLPNLKSLEILHYYSHPNSAHSPQLKAHYP